MPPNSASGRSSISRLLVYRIGQIGDTIVSMPAFWALREAFPKAHLALLADENDRAPGLAGSDRSVRTARRALPADENDRPHFATVRHVLPPTGLFDEYLTYPGDRISDPWIALKEAMKLRRHQFDALAYLAPRLRSPRQVRRDLLFFRLAGFRRVLGRTGFEDLPTIQAGGHLRSVIQEADHLLHRLALSGVPVPAEGQGSTELCLTREECDAAAGWLKANVNHRQDARLVALSIGGKFPAQHWENERYAALGKKLVADLNVFPIVFGGPGERDDANALVQHWGRGAVAAGELSIRESAAAIKECSLYVGNDTGTLHLAAAVGTRCVGVFSGRNYLGEWWPYGPNHVVLQHEVSCSPCRLNVCEREGLRCLTSITVDEVFEACQRALSEPPA